MSNWVLLRGLARAAGQWGDFREKIVEEFPKDRFEFLDIPGNGVNHRQESPLNIPAIVESLRAQSQFVQRQQKLTLLAISLGAMIAVEWARLYPDEVERLILINTSAANFSPFYQRLRPQNYPRLLKLLAEKNIRQREAQILEMVANSPSRREEILPQWVTESEVHSMLPRNAVRQLIAAGRYHFPKKAPVPTLIFTSLKDRFVAPECSLKLAQKWDVPLEVHPWAGHDLPLDDAEWLLTRLKKIQAL